MCGCVGFNGCFIIAVVLLLFSRSFLSEPLAYFQFSDEWAEEKNFRGQNNASSTLNPL